MKEFIRRLQERKFFNKTAIISVLSLLILNNILYFFVDINDEFIFNFYTKGYFSFVTSLEQILFRIFPFSVGDFFYLFLFFLILLISIRIIYKLIKKSFKDALWTFIDLASLVLFIFLILSLQWNWNYKQPAINKKLGFEEKEYQLEEIALFAETLINKTKETKEFANFDIFRDNFGSLTDIAPLGYDELAKKDDFYSYNFTCVKESLFSSVLPYLGISGYYNPFTAEAHVTKGIPIVQRAFVINHEIAHQLGIASETEANFIAYIASINNPLTTIQYSGHLILLHYTMGDLYRNKYKDYDVLVDKIPEEVKKDLNSINQYWHFYKNEYRKYTDRGYDMFLKANYQKHGIKSYNRVVSLALSYQKHKNNEKNINN